MTIVANTRVTDRGEREAMDRPHIFVTSTEEEWLALRENDITSTRAAVLFGESRYQTPYDLWHEMKGNKESGFEETERMKWGKRLESVIAEGWGEDNDCAVKPAKFYARHAYVDRMGSSFDYSIESVGGNAPKEIRDLWEERGQGILEIKKIDSLQFRDHWKTEEGIEPPLDIELQVQHQMEVLDIGWAVIACLVGGNEVEYVVRERRTQIGQAIIKHIVSFVESLDNNDPPAPDYMLDAVTIMSMNVDDDGSEIDLRDRDDLMRVADDYVLLGEREKEIKKQRAECKARIIDAIGPAKKAYLDGFNVSAGTVAETEIEAYTRKAYRGFRVTKKKEKKNG